MITYDAGHSARRFFSGAQPLTISRGRVAHAGRRASLTANNRQKAVHSVIRSLLSSVALTAVLVAVPHITAAQSVSGSYLAGRQAAMTSDFEAASRYFQSALARDPGNVELMESAIVSQLALGRVDRPCPLRVSSNKMMCGVRPHIW